MIAVVQEGPPRSGIGRRAGSIARGAGRLLLGFATLASVPTFLLGLVVVLDVLPGGRSPLDDLSSRSRGGLLAWWSASVVVVGLAWVVGLRLARGTRRLVVFLRRFRDRPSIGALSAAAETLGGSWRLVTLDGRDDVDPLGVDDHVTAWAGRAERGFDLVFGRGEALVRRAVAAGKTVAGAAAIGAALSGCVAALAFDGPPAARLEAVIGLLWTDDRGVAGTVFTLCMAVLGACFVAAMVSLPVLVLTLAALPVAGASGVVDRGIRRGEHAKVVHVDVIEEIAPARERVHRIVRRVLSPRLIVLKVDDEVWRQTVLSFAAEPAVVLIDVSVPSEHVLWEIEQLSGRRCVFVAEHGRLGPLVDGPSTDPHVRRLRALLDGRRVLAYRTDPAGVRRFAEALRDTFDALVSGRADRHRVT